MNDFPSIPMTTEETIEFNKWLEEHDKQLRADVIEFISDKLIYPLLDECDRGLWEHIDYIELAKNWIKVLDDNPYPKVKNYTEARKKRIKAMDSRTVKGAEKMKTTIELPCAVGDKAFYVTENGIIEVEVDSFIFNINIFVNVSFYIGGERFGKTLTPYKTLFFTLEEAKKMWEQLKEQK